jgi:hypothetical protein
VLAKAGAERERLVEAIASGGIALRRCGTSSATHHGGIYQSALAG